MKRFIEVLEDNIKSFPERVVLRSNAREKGITYGELDEYSARIYSYLKSHNVGKEDMVLIKMPRGIRAIVCIVGVIKAGAAYVIVENTYAPDRISFIKNDCNCKIVIDENVYADMMDCKPLLGHEETDLHDACYAVYTSGSTGNPKGVLHEYGKLDISLFGLKEFLPTAEGSIFALIAPLNFVASALAMQYVLRDGKCLYIVSYDITKNPKTLTEFLEKEKVTHAFLPPSLLKIYKNPSPYLVNVALGGEPCNGVYVDKLHIVNSYAASESGMVMSSFVIDKLYEKTPAGKNNDGFKIFIIGEDGSILPNGETGEICFENQYTRGYINLPEKNIDTFVDGIFHTGDLGYIDENGNLVVSGRKDDMIKINGNRIEPAEIESATKKTLGISNVIAKGFSEKDRSFICEYLIRDELKTFNLLDDNGNLIYSSDEMKEKLSSKLPYYMIPTYYVVLDAFPKNANGKIAKKELMAPNTDSYAEEYVAPENDNETYFCELFKKILNKDKVGVNDDFYLIGGDSITSISLIGDCKFKGLTVGDLYKYRTPRKLAEYYFESFGDLKDIDEKNKKALKHSQTLSTKMMDMINVQLLDPKSTIWNLANILKMTKGIDPYKLAKAVDKVLLAHPVFETMFYYDEFSNIRQKYVPEMYKNVTVTELTLKELEEKKSSFIKPYELFNKFLYRAEVFKTEEDVYLLLDIHHSITDGTSIDIIIKQIIQCYEDIDYEIPTDYYYLASREREKYCLSDEAKQVLDYYDKLSQTVRKGTCAYLPTVDHQSKKMSGARIVEALSIDKTFNGNDKLKAIGGNILFMTVYLLTASKYNNNDNAYLQWIFNGRDDSLKINSVGVYIRTLPLFGVLDRDKKLVDLFKEIKEQVDYSTAHCESEFVNPFVNGGQFESVFLYQKEIYNIDRIEGIDSFEFLSDDSNGADSAFEFSLLDESTRDGFACDIEYSIDHYDEESIRKFIKIFDEYSKKICSIKDFEHTTIKDIY